MTSVSQLTSAKSGRSSQTVVAKVTSDSISMLLMVHRCSRVMLDRTREFLAWISLSSLVTLLLELSSLLGVRRLRSFWIYKHERQGVGSIICNFLFVLLFSAFFFTLCLFTFRARTQKTSGLLNHHFTFFTVRCKLFGGQSGKERPPASSSLSWVGRLSAPSKTTICISFLPS